MFSIFANIYFLPSQEQSVQIGLLTVCENLATCEKTQFTPLLYLVLLKLNRPQQYQASGHMPFSLPRPYSSRFVISLEGVYLFEQSLQMSIWVPLQDND